MTVDAKIYLIELLKQDPMNQYTLHWLPKNALGAIHKLSVVENMLVDFISSDKEGVDLQEIFSREPSRDEYSTEEDYQNALMHHKALKQLITLGSKLKSKVNTEELIYVIEYLMALKSTLYAMNSLDGKRIRLLSSDTIKYHLEGRKASLGKMLGGGDKDE